MNHPAQYSYSDSRQYREPDDMQWAIKPGERIGTPLRRRRGRIVRRALFVFGLIGLGITHYHDPTAVPGWSVAAYEVVGPLVNRAFERSGHIKVAGADQMPGHAPSSVKPDEADQTQGQPATDQPTPGLKQGIVSPPAMAADPSAEAATPSPPVVIAALAPIKTVETPPAATRPKAEDRHHVRARIAGLHPDLSYVLLAQMSETDFKNAAIAISRAVAETRDDATFVWPQASANAKSKTDAKLARSKLAIFKIHFVSGASPGCRRYVVTIEKNRWMTTALPLERCGADAAAFGKRQAARRKSDEVRRSDVATSVPKAVP